MLYQLLNTENFVKKRLIYILIIICVLFFDLSSKYFVNNMISENESISVLGNFLKFTLSYNYGTTFGYLKDYAPYIAISAVKSILIIILVFVFLKISTIIKHTKYQMISRICILFLIGGSLGNIIDRLLDKRVTDFIDVGINGYRWHIFNLADAFQCVGGLVILFFLIFEYSKKHKKSINQEAPK